jgi:hypothetical protein
MRENDKAHNFIGWVLLIIIVFLVVLTVLLDCRMTAMENEVREYHQETPGRWGN